MAKITPYKSHFSEKMKRDIEKILITWQQQLERLPLLVRGARQVGKTYVIEEFGKQYFDSLLTINFEYEPQYKGCFDSLNPVDIINAVQILSGQKIEAGSTLLFLDEIQECPKAILALRYFKEKMPQLHVIAAGSLLEFTLNEPEFRMPVGRVQSIFLKPLSFREYLRAIHQGELLNWLGALNVGDSIPDALHQQGIKLVREYMITGGMPAVIASHIQDKDLMNSQNIQSALINTFRNDFGHYATKTQHGYLRTVFEKVTGLSGQIIKYKHIDENARSRALKIAIEQLSDAGLVTHVYSTSASGLPLNAQMNEKKFKLVFLDVGLLSRSTQLDAKLLLSEDLLLVNRGAMAEQLVAQELLAYGTPYENPPLYFWARDKRGSEAEIDYVIQLSGEIIPVEVKSGMTGHLKSLRLFMEEKNSPLAIRISQHPLSIEGKLLSIPLYMIFEMERLAAGCL